MSLPKPPKFANWLARQFCPDHLKEELEGDLLEAFDWRVRNFGMKKARWYFLIDAIRTIQLSRPKPAVSLNQNIMIQRNYIKTGWRFLKKNTFYSSLNILGLAIGISFCWLAYLYAEDETSYDKHLSNEENLFRIVIDFKRGDDLHHLGGSSNAMAVQFLEKIPEVRNFARIKSDFGLIKKDEETLEQSLILADKEIVNMLDLKFLEGEAGAFDQPNEVVISETLAGKLDLRGNAAGKILSLNRGDEFESFIIRGVYEDIPLNTSVRRDLIMSYANYLANAPERRLTTWFDINMNVLLELHPETNLGAVMKQMDELHIENVPDSEAEVHIQLQPISQIHLDDNYGHYNGVNRGGNLNMIKLFAGIGIFCLLISMINYSNFNISLYINRAREVALRKVIGAEKSGIFNQLITESMLSSIIAGVLALVLVTFLLPTFSLFVEKSYTIYFLLNSKFILGALTILFGTALLSGFYPALILSRFSIVKSLKGEQKIRSGKWITQVLLAIQFVIATGLIAGVITMNKQVNYLTSFDTKINDDNVIYFDYIIGEESQIKSFMNVLDQVPEVKEVAAVSGYNGTRIVTDEDQFDVRHLRIHRDLLHLLDIEIVQGENFNSGANAGLILVNQAFVKRMGLTDPIGEVVPFKYGDLENPTIIGVVEDYHYESLSNLIDPLVIYVSEEYPLQSLYVRFHEEAAFDQRKFEAIWKNHFDPFPMEYQFLEEAYASAYEEEQRMVQLVGIGCVVSVFLAGFGLLGIVGLQLNQRLKEISIRKILGATPTGLYGFFSQKFILIIGLGLSIGLIVGLQLIQQWLNDYPYKVNIGFSTIAMTILFTLSIALITIISQVFRVTRANPVEYLRDD